MDKPFHPGATSHAGCRPHIRNPARDHPGRATDQPRHRWHLATTLPARDGLPGCLGRRETIVIATATGQLGVSTDTGASWTLNPKRLGTPEALFAWRQPDGRVEIVIVADAKVMRTFDGGSTSENLIR